jgi:chromosome segregation ATPase
MVNETLIATLKETLCEVSEKLAQSEAALAQLREELAAFSDILQHARHRETQANCQYEEVFKKYRELLATSSSLPHRPYPLVEKIGELSAEQMKAHDNRLAAKEAVTKYQEQVRVAEVRLEMQESKRQSLQKASDDLTWQIKKLSAAHR